MSVISKAIDEMRTNDLLDDITNLADYVRDDCHDDFLAEALEDIMKDVKELIDDVKKSGIDSAKNEAIAA
tara:strand:+ start:412 stop:621 length:210 start_codon:yes stop_codon:yes gene_type:complete